MARAQTIQIYLPSGDPAGLRVANLTTRTVRVFEVPRSLLAQFLQRPEAGQVGVYYLFGSSDDETPQCYIGQSGNVGVRLQQHAASKDFWTRALVAVSLTNEWTSTHVAYLEWLSLARATTAGRYALVNGNQASNPYTPEPLEADCQEFIDTIAVLLATLGSPVLEAVRPGATAASPADGVAEAEPELLFFREAGCDASGYQTPEGLLVLAGAKGRATLRPSALPSLSRQRDSLEAEGVIKFEGEELVFFEITCSPVLLLRGVSSSGVATTDGPAGKTSGASPSTPSSSSHWVAARGMANDPASRVGVRDRDLRAPGRPRLAVLADR